MCAIEYYTYDDYMQWEGDWELIDGEALAIPSHTINHQAIAGIFASELMSIIDTYSNCIVIGKIDWKITESTVLKPDVVLICDETNENYLTKSPEIVIEVISKSTARRDEKFKFEIYEQEKVPYYILAYPNDCKAKIFKLVDGKYSKEGDFSKETYEFENTICKAKIDFDVVFRRFRK